MERIRKYQGNEKLSGRMKGCCASYCDTVTEPKYIVDVLPIFLNARALHELSCQFRWHLYNYLYVQMYTIITLLRFIIS